MGKAFILAFGTQEAINDSYQDSKGTLSSGDNSRCGDSMEVIFCGKDSLDQNHPIEIDGELQMQVTNVVLNCLCVSELVMGCRLPPRRERRGSFLWLRAIQEHTHL